MLSLVLQVPSPCPHPQLLPRLPIIVSRKPGMEVGLGLAPAPAPALVLVPTRAHPAPVGTVARRVEERNGAGHDHHIAPDILAGL